MISSDNKTFTEITRGFSAHLKFLMEIGVHGVDCSAKTLQITNSWEEAPAGPYVKPSAVSHQKCRDCSLIDQYPQMVCGAGSQNPRLVIVGGVASEDDRKEGKPFTGKTGALLDKILGAMNLTREEVYITRAVKCHPPDSRKPAMADVKACRVHLGKELSILRPEIILAFGEVAAMSLLETSVPLSRLRGRFHPFNSIQVMPTYSPEHLLEDQTIKRDVWEDLKLVMAELRKPPMRS